MKIEERIEKMKKVYQETSVSDEQMIQEWQLLENVLGEQKQPTVSPLFFRTFAFAAVVVLLSGGVVTIAQASKPGELLYPVKEFSQQVVEEVKQSVPVFDSVTPTPIPPSQEVNDEDQLRQDKQTDTVKGANDAMKGNSDEEKNENSSWNNAGGNSEEQKNENNGSAGSPPGGNNHSGSDNSNNNNQPENGKKENSPNSEKVDKSNSEHEGNSNGNSPKK